MPRKKASKKSSPEDTGALIRQTFSDAVTLLRDKYPEAAFVSKLGSEGIAVLSSREFTHEAVATLVSVMRYGKSDTAKLKAANALLDRGWGLPTKTMHVEGSLNHKHEHELTDEQLAKIIIDQREQDGLVEYEAVIDSEEELEAADGDAH